MKENKVDIIKSKLDNVGDFIHRNSRIKYISFTMVFLGGLIFFLSSNMLFNNTSSNDISTAIGTPLSSDPFSVTLKDREYNPTNGFIKFVVNIQNVNKDKKFIPNFELRSKDNPAELIPITAQKVTDNEYVIYTTYNKKWSYISLAVNFVSETDVNEIIGPFKMYSTLADISLNENLVQKSNKDYYVEIVDSEINDIKLEIDNLKSDINKNLQKIENIKNENTKLEEGKKYQIETEIANTNNQISSNLSAIEQINNDNTERQKTIENLEEKIGKLQIKKTDYLIGTTNATDN